ncbi:MAG: hypothetical protein JWO40_731 [Candidatus Doudnabacteria bacterium]|nr:hypothetical protein [Candidatus Doudnabacteria bacterium]
MKKIVYVVLLLLVLGGGIFFIYSAHKSGTTPIQQYGILNPNPADNSNNTNVSTAPVQSPVVSTPAPTNTQPSSGAVLGATEKPVVKTPVSAPVPKPVTSAPTGLSNYQIAELNFSISVPSNLQPRLETAAGNVLAFYNPGGTEFGQIEVISDAEQSFESLSNEISANKNVSNIQQITINGQPALIFNDQRFGGSKVIALAYGNNVYYLRGSNALRPYTNYFKFIN